MNTITRTWRDLLVLTSLLTCLLASAAQGQASLDSDLLIMEKLDVSSKLRAPDRTPNLRVYANGRVEVYRPVYMKHSGRFEGQIDDATLAEVIEMVAALRQFDPLEAETLYVQASQAQQRATGTLRYVSETRWTQYTVGPVGNRQVVVVEDARLKAERFPNLYVWSLMARIDETLSLIEQHDSLVRLGDALPMD